MSNSESQEEIKPKSKKITKKTVKHEESQDESESKQKAKDLHANPKIEFEEDREPNGDHFEALYPDKVNSQTEEEAPKKKKKITKKARIQETATASQVDNALSELDKVAEETKGENEKTPKKKTEKKKKEKKEKKKPDETKIKPVSMKKSSKRASNKIYSNIKELQKSRQTMIPKAIFDRLAREIFADAVENVPHFKSGYKIKKAAMFILHLATEDLLSCVFNQAIILLHYKKRKELRLDTLAVVLKFNPLAHKFVENIKCIEKKAQDEAAKNAEIRKRARKQANPKKLVVKKE